MTHTGYPELGLFIDNTLVPGTGTDERFVVNPATGEQLARLPIASRDDLDRALASAERLLHLAEEPAE